MNESPRPKALHAGDRVVVASHNIGKVWEMAELLAPYGIETLAAAELNLPEPEETGTSFIENAALKAVAAAEGAGLPALADDSGLEVAAIGGDPGLFSARWGGPKRDFGLAMEKVHQAMLESGSADKTCNFTCALALAWPDGTVRTFEGKVFGTYVWPPRGENGFGYDPVFLPDGQAETFGEMDQDEKHAMSHRAVAFAAMMKALYNSDV
ncbi:RdgB/HAM1 family non-canonical purine NTP pyrophosphatase [Methyloligella sp. 2.7D]|uniref:RdgB/HAM1 family non-canonical purine NTP pyrophosphatase n=1 Tax=unclassified Methyloligella TaxID=2625955 RepID=UPI00157DCD3C|nr:RdgB/HAM1 family non-canonical purine NTP pyrophosphatase [Methyloligella sp. GL2]QKP76149.1 RdgB/HAM1 family non-canonical purine NTP pyrophosphatase [Methyloligella sp. GL2]